MCTVDAQNLALLPVLHELVNFGEKVGNNILAWQLGETWLFLKLCLTSCIYLSSSANFELGVINSSFLHLCWRVVPDNNSSSILQVIHIEYRLKLSRNRFSSTRLTKPNNTCPCE